MSARMWNIALIATIIGFCLIGFGLPIGMTIRNLDYGRKVQSSLRISLQEKYPDISFENGGVGYEAPSVGIRIVKKIGI